MWKAAAGQQVNLAPQNTGDDDDWETDPDFVNNVDEQEQRWGSTTVEGSGRSAGAIDMDQLRRETEQADSMNKRKQMNEDPSNPSFGYGGKFGLEKDRMDKSAVGHEYIAKVEKHGSQKDYSTGFGGKFGVQTDRVDKSAVSWEHKEKLQKHASQKDYATGFGGKFGVQTDRQDKSAMGWDHIEKLQKHDSQKDYVKGFGGKFGVQSDRQDKSAVGWDHHEAPQKHESQTDQKIGFGGKFGLQTDRVDKSASTFDDPGKIGTNYTKVTPDIAGAKPSNLRAKFENLAQQDESREKIAPKKIALAKTAMFSNNQGDADNKSEHQEKAPPGQLNRSKFAQFSGSEGEVVKSAAEQKPVVGKLTGDQTGFLATPPTSAPAQQHDQTGYLATLPTSAPAQQHDQTGFLATAQQHGQTGFLATSSTPTTAPVPQQQPEVQRDKERDTHKQVEEMRQKQIEQEEQELYENLQNPPQEFEDEVPAESGGDSQESYSQDEIVDTGIAATALYDYQAAAEDEISFDPDDVITHIEKIDEGWWRGLCKGKYGLFPANYVQVSD